MSKMARCSSVLFHIVIFLSQQNTEAFVWSTPCNYAALRLSYNHNYNNKQISSNIRIGTTERHAVVSVADENDDDNNDGQKQKKSAGDELRRQTCIRPSLHPITINALTEALRLRASKEGEVVTNGENALEVAMLAGKLAIDALAKREKMLKSVTNISASDGTSLDDGDDNIWELPTEEEKQVIAGRVLGVVMRLKDLEQSLVEKVSQTKWVVKYGEHETFGVLATEADISVEVGYELDERLNIDPLFRMNRAECLLALFIESIEKPQLAKAEASVPDGSKVDFLDGDRLEVLVM